MIRHRTTTMTTWISIPTILAVTATATTPDQFPDIAKAERPLQSSGRLIFIGNRIRSRQLVRRH
jgi:hypothetical protein